MDGIIDLVEKKQFRVMLNPVRQEMVHLLRLVARPLSANEVAERMQLSPNAAHTHLTKLVKMGLVSAKEGKRVDGSQTTYYQMRDVKLRLCLGLELAGVLRLDLQRIGEKWDRILKEFRANQQSFVC